MLLCKFKFTINFVFIYFYPCLICLSFIFITCHNYFSLGFGVFTTKSFQKGSFLLEYPGELVSDKEGENRHLDYGRRSLGSFLYFFEDGKKKLW